MHALRGKQPGNDGKNGDGGQGDDPARELEDSSHQGIQHINQRLCPAAGGGQRKAQQHCKHQHWQKVGAGHGREHVGGDHVEEKLCPVDRGIDVLGQFCGVRQIDAHAGVEHAVEGKANDDRNHRGNEKIEQADNGNLTQLLGAVAHLVDAKGDGREHQRHHDHLDGLHKGRTHRGQGLGKVRREKAEHNAQNKAEHHLNWQRNGPLFAGFCHFHRLSSPSVPCT